MQTSPNEEEDEYLKFGKNKNSQKKRPLAIKEEEIKEET